MKGCRSPRCAQPWREVEQVGTVPSDVTGAKNVGAIQWIEAASAAKDFVVNAEVFVSQAQIQVHCRTHFELIHDVTEILGHPLPGQWHRSVIGVRIDEILQKCVGAGKSDGLIGAIG